MEHMGNSTSLTTASGGLSLLHRTTVTYITNILLEHDRIGDRERDGEEGEWEGVAPK